MSWALFWAALAFAGLVPLAVLSARVLVAARGLGRELERTRSLLPAEQDTTGHKNG
jgi:hypothetical protein